MKNALNKHRYIYGLTIAFGILSAVFMAGFSLYLGKIIDAVSSGGALLHTMMICFLMLAAWMICSFLFDRSEMAFSNRVLRHIKERMYDALYRNDLRTYLETSDGDHLGFYSKDMDLLTENYLIPRCGIVQNACSAVICLVAIFLISWKLGIAFVIISAATVILSQIPGVMMQKKTQEYSAESAAYLGTLKSYLNGYEQVRLLGLGRVFHHRMDEQDARYENARRSYLFVKVAANDLGMAIGMLSQLLCMSIGIFLVSRGGLTIGLLLSAVNLLNGVFGPLQGFMNNKNLMGTAKEIIEKADARMKVNENPGEAIPGIVNDIVFDHVSIVFGEKEILQNYSKHFEAGKKYVIMGESGRGKSTLAKLLMKYYDGDAYQGNILINHQDIRSLRDESIYGRIAYIQRSTFLVRDTVKNNVLLYREGTDEARQEEIFKRVRFDRSFSDKMIEDTEMSTVSFGEMQRIDMARFMLNDYDVMIFDEPTNGLDAETAKDVFDMIFDIRDKIVIVITHDQAEENLQRFDDIIRL